jgi:uncharacterized protein YunC (DUF1805 family)
LSPIRAPPTKNQYGHSSLITGVTDDGGQLCSYLLVDRQMNPRVGRAVGWDSVQTIEPSLNAPSPEVVNDAFDDAGAIGIRRGVHRFSAAPAIVVR